MGRHQKPWFWSSYSGSVEDFIRNADAIKLLVLEGGEDISPYLYGQLSTHSHAGAPSSRDMKETILYHAARALSIPILGICRGHQLVAALNGGTLHQDIERECKGRERTRTSHIGRHGIIYYADWFEELMQSNPGGPRTVNSIHHQAVKDIPTNATLLALADDGVVEALWYEDLHVLTVQWHPEMLGHDELFEFVAGTNSTATVSTTTAEAQDHEEVKAITSNPAEIVLAV